MRSIQRAVLFLHFLDITKKDFLKDLKEIDTELEIFDKNSLGSYFEKLSVKKKFYILTKIDQIDKKEKLKSMAQKMNLKKGDRLFFLSNKSKKGFSEIMTACHKELTRQKA